MRPAMLTPLVYLWASPATLLGLAIALFSPHRQVHTGVLEVSGGLATFALTHLTLLPGGASAMTLGHVVIGRDAICLVSTREHERVHVRQVERWGPLFIPAYLLASVWIKIRGRGNAYLDNPFEVEAYRIAP